MADIAWLKRVWTSGPAYVNDRAVLLVLVDVMSDDGHRAWPSVETIASRVGISTRAVRTRLRALEADGWITAEALGGGRHRTTRYVVNVAQLKPGRNPEETRKPATGNPEVDDLNPEATSADRLYRLREGGAGVVDNPLPVITDAPLPCAKHPNGWHHREPCGRCASLREYDGQQRTAAASRPAWSACGEGGCVNGWIEDPETGMPREKCACHPSFGVTPITTTAPPSAPRKNGEPVAVNGNAAFAIFARAGRNG